MRTYQFFTQKFQILQWYEQGEAYHFMDRSSIVRLLEALLTVPENAVALRQLAAATTLSDLSQMQDIDLIEVVSWQIFNRNLKVVAFGESTTYAFTSGAHGAPADSDQSQDELQEEGVEQPNEEKELDWVEVQLVDSDGEPLAGIECELTTPDSVQHVKKTDSNGFVSLYNIPPGICKIRYSIE